MNSTVRLSFRYTPSDYSRATRAHYASRAQLRLDVFVVVVIAAAGAYLLLSASSYWLGLACVVGSVGFGVLLVLGLLVIPTLAFRVEPKFRDDYSLMFSDEGIHFRTIHIDSQLQWSMYSRALIDPHSYLLYYGKRQFTVIPKRVFESTDQREAFEQLLVQHVSKIVRRDS